MSAKVWKMYSKAKVKRFSADSTVDNGLADEKLQTLNEVGVADQCLDVLSGPSSFLYAH